MRSARQSINGRYNENGHLRCICRCELPRCPLPSAVCSAAASTYTLPPLKFPSSQLPVAPRSLVDCPRLRRRCRRRNCLVFSFCGLCLVSAIFCSYCLRHYMIASHHRLPWVYQCTITSWQDVSPGQSGLGERRRLPDLTRPNLRLGLIASALAAGVLMSACQQHFVGGFWSHGMLVRCHVRLMFLCFPSSSLLRVHCYCILFISVYFTSIYFIFVFSKLLTIYFCLLKFFDNFFLFKK